MMNLHYVHGQLGYRNSCFFQDMNCLCASSCTSCYVQSYKEGSGYIHTVYFELNWMTTFIGQKSVPVLPFLSVDAGSAP